MLVDIDKLPDRTPAMRGVAATVTEHELPELPEVHEPAVPVVWKSPVIVNPFIVYVGPGFAVVNVTVFDLELFMLVGLMLPDDAVI